MIPGMTKVAISIPDELSAAFDMVARQRGMSRSALVAEAMRQLLDTEDAVTLKQAIAELYASQSGEEATAERDLRRSIVHAQFDRMDRDGMTWDEEIPETYAPTG